MDQIHLDIQFLDLTGVPEDEVKHLREILNPAIRISTLELPWKNTFIEDYPKIALGKDTSQDPIYKNEQCDDQRPAVNVEVPEYLPSVPVVTSAHPETIPYVPTATSVAHFHQNVQPIHFIPRPMFPAHYAMRVPLPATQHHGTQEIMMVQQPFHGSLSSNEGEGRPDDLRTKQRTMGGSGSKQFRHKVKKKPCGMVDVDSYASLSSTAADKQLVLGMQSPGQVEAGSETQMSPMSHSLPPFIHPSYSLGPAAAYQHLQYSHQHPTQQMIYVPVYNAYPGYITQAQATPVDGDHTIEGYDCTMGQYDGRQEQSPLHLNLDNFSNSGQEQCCVTNLENNVVSTPPGFQEQSFANAPSVYEPSGNEDSFSAQNENSNSGTEPRTSVAPGESETVVNNSHEEKNSLPENSTGSCNNTYGNNRKWADLFKKESGSSLDSSSSVPSSKSSKNISAKSDENIVALDSAPLSQKFGKFVQSYQLDFTPKPIQPRGLINKSNWCYINATLQVILTCPPFYNLVNSLVPFASQSTGKSATPILDSLVELFSEFTELPGDSRIKHKDDLNVGSPFEPVCIHRMLTVIKSECVKGRQEDAEEFLGCILNGLHEELLVAMKTIATENGTTCNGTAESNGHILGESDDDDWQVMGPKKRSMATRSDALSSSPITAIFGGQTRSVLNAGSEMSAVLQPFFTLQLDVQADNIESVKDALGQLTAKEPIQGYICPKTKQEVEAYRRTTLEELPPVLILHFKRFVYDKDGGSKKVLKNTDYPMDLEIGKELLSPESKSKNSAKQIRNYKLFAVVYHDGKEAMKGHYIADIYHAGMGSWLRCDDRNISLTSEAQVQRYNSPCVPYLLFYGRSEGHANSK